MIDPMDEYVDEYLLSRRQRERPSSDTHQVKVSTPALIPRGITLRSSLMMSSTLL
jgi:hypothetical protein